MPLPERRTGRASTRRPTSSPHTVRSDQGCRRDALQCLRIVVRSGRVCRSFHERLRLRDEPEGHLRGTPRSACGGKTPGREHLRRWAPGTGLPLRRRLDRRPVTCRNLPLDRAPHRWHRHLHLGARTVRAGGSRHIRTPDRHCARRRTGRRDPRSEGQHREGPVTRIPPPSASKRAFAAYVGESPPTLGVADPGAPA